MKPELLTFESGSREWIDPALWSHPMLALFHEAEAPSAPLHVPRKLFLVPTPNVYPGEVADPDCPPRPSPISDLPALSEWVERFVVAVVEIWGGRRHPMQLARWCHRSVHAQLVRKSATFSEIPRIRKMYLTEPIEGVCEATITLRIKDRVRSLILRFEGVDKRWLCTELILL